MMKNDLSLESHPGYAAAFKRLHEVYRELDNAKAKAQRLQNEVLSTAQRRVGSIDVEAAARLAGNDVEALNGLQENYAKARREVEVLCRMVKLAEEAVAREKTPASLVLCRKMATEYGVIVRAIAAALIALGQSVEAEMAIRHKLAQAGANFYLQPMTFAGAGATREYGSRISIWLCEAVVHGFIERSEIPQPWLDVWGCYIDAEIKANREAAQPAPATLASRPQSSGAKTNGQAHA